MKIQDVSHLCLGRLGNCDADDPMTLAPLSLLLPLQMYSPYMPFPAQYGPQGPYRFQGPGDGPPR